MLMMSHRFTSSLQIGVHRLAEIWYRGCDDEDVAHDLTMIYQSESLAYFIYRRYPTSDVHRT